MSELPIEFTELVDLTSIGISPQSLDFRSATFESDRYVTVRETTNGANSVAIVDLLHDNEVTRKSMGGDSAIMHPTQKVISVRANGTIVQMFNLDTKEKLKSFQVDEPVIFWKWLSDEVLGIVTTNSLLLCNAFDGEPSAVPARLTARNVNLNNTQIINFVANKSMDWFAVIGIIQENGHIAGKIQLYSKARNISQAIDGHVAAFISLLLEGNTEPVQVFVTGNRNTTTGVGELRIIEIDHNAQANPVQYQKKAVDIFFPPDATNDFPLSVQVSEKYGIIYILTKYGFIHLYELETGSNLFVNRITAESVFTATHYNNRNGIACINKKGQVLTVEIDKEQLVPYVLKKLSNVSLALTIASRGNLPGADNLFEEQFKKLIEQGDYQNAARVAASSEKLRTQSTINKLKHVQSSPGAISPILLYFSTLLDKGKLNKYETIELAKPVLQQDRKQLFEKWLKEDKLECSEELGDVVHSFDITLALACYLRSQTHSKVITCLAELEQFDKIIPYSQKVGFQPNFVVLIADLMRSSPDKASEFAINLLKSPETASQLDYEKIAEMFFSQNHIQQGTSFLLDALKGDTPEHGHLQTRVLEVNLKHAPQVADAILGNSIFSHYDRITVAKLCEKAGLYQSALQNYTDIKDIKRCITHTSALPADWLVGYFGKLNVQQSLACLRALMDSDLKLNMQIIVNVAIKFSDLFSPEVLIKLFEDYKATEGLYNYLKSIVHLTNDPEIVFKYIQAAVKVGEFQEVQKIVKSSNVYDPEKIRNYLKDSDLPDQLPLVIVCDRFDYVHDLVLYLHKTKNMRFIDIYVQQINPSKTPQVVAGLLDVNCDEHTIQKILKSVSGHYSISELTAEVEKRNRLKMLLPILEEALEKGTEDQAVYNALAKIYIDSNNSPEKFLRENDNYDTLDVGRYCEKRDPYLAYIAYDKGGNDEDLVRITNENSMYKYQARYLLKRSDLEFWSSVLDEDGGHRKQLLESVIGVGIPELTDPEPVSITVQAFMNAGLKLELIELLEKIILEPSPFNDNAALQGLLMLSAVKYEPSKVTTYIEKLDNYDVDDIAPMCIEAGLNEEAFELYDKNERYEEALQVLVENIMSLDRAESYADKIDKASLWSQLGCAQLNNRRISEAIESYIKAEDPSNYETVIKVAEDSDNYEDLIPFLIMSRKSLKEPVIDGALILSYAKLDKINEIEKLLNSNNVADLEDVGDTLSEIGNFKAAKLCYSSISNYSKLATTLVHLKDYQAAVETARKASNVRVWGEVNNACIKNKEFRLAQICGLELIVHAEELDDLVVKYEKNGYVEELISMFEAGLALERAHMGMFTELAILYTKYDPSKTYEHLKLFWSRINMPKVIRATEKAHLWPELIFLYAHYDEWDNAALTVIERSAGNFDHDYFKEIIVKVSNLEIYYKAINFYVKEHPALLVDLLSALTPRLDIPRAIKIFSKSDNLPLIKPFLIGVLPKNYKVVNEAYHELMIEEENYNALQSAVLSYDKFDQLALAAVLEKHDLIFFKKIAALLYNRNKKWDKSLSILKANKLWKEAIETAALSQTQSVAEGLLKYFVDTGNKEGFVALLYTAYNLIRYEYVLEVAWWNGLDSLVKPYEISIKKEQYDIIAKLSEQLSENKSKDYEGDKPLLLTNSSVGYHTTGF
ncbi:HGR109Cp [Eremothecium sinecaudum]|uniref:Clathrin heavy chain n=1 Tax=Eremothecium sinecaudum TaxID=45286 RepID=A0A0X8HW08_9SACH|nr:HGR109Cp [Eremothecium sinecaudum]AMD22448.1 HGR109Cp [Eremothecium sinecaudum]